MNETKTSPDEMAVRLNHSSDHLARILDTAIDAIISADSSGRILFWNSAAERLYGYTREEASRLEITSLMPEAYKAGHSNGFRRFLSTGIPKIIGTVVEVECLRKDGTTVPAELSLSADRVDGDWVFTAIIRDATEKKAARERDKAQSASIVKANSELSVLYKVSSAISGAVDLNETLHDILHTITELDIFKVEHLGGIFLIKGDRMELAAHLGHSESFIDHHRDMRVGECLCGLSAKTGEIVISEDSSTDERHTIRYAGMPPHGHIIVPLKDRDGVVGVMYLYTAAGRRIDEQTIMLLSAIASNLGVGIRKHMLLELTKELSLSDHLTNVGNKRRLDIELNRLIAKAKRYSRPFSCLMLDIDHFKMYNDAHGHLAGDEVLKGVAMAIQSMLRETDLLARYGGEEFMVLMPETTIESALIVAEKIRECVKRTLPVTVSLGAISYKEDMSDAADLIEAVDRLLYSAKELGRNMVVIE